MPDLTHRGNKCEESHTSASEKDSAKSFYWRLVPFDLQPIWLKDNEFLHTNFRPVNYSYWNCIKSIFILHTETFNIWTHLLGCIFVLIMTISALYIHTFKLSNIQIQLHSLPAIEKLMFSIFAISAVSCLFGSVTFHTFNCHSESTARFFNKIDYLGITILIIASCFPLIYYAFYCSPLLICTYCAIFVLIGGVSCYVSLNDKFRTRKYRAIRCIMFISLGCMSVVPAIHVITERGFDEALERYAFHWLLFMAFSYVFGAFIYSMRIPERFFPGKFDIFAHSHQIFHMFVIVGIIAHYECVTSTASYYHRHQSICENVVS